MSQPTEPSPAAPGQRFTSDGARHRALVERDGRADGVFFYAVVTTGVYCRPSCPARLALAKNVRFFSSAVDAEREGYRACLRCRPRELSLAERRRAMIDRARELLTAAAGPRSLHALAEELAVSPHHLHRVFRAETGLTPRAYAAAHRLGSAARALVRGASVTRALHEAGYGSTARFYEHDSAALGMTPSQLRRGGEGIDIRSIVQPCALGTVLVGATARGVCAVAFGDGEVEVRRELYTRFPRACHLAPDETLRELAQRVVQIVNGSGVRGNLPLDLLGTAFQQRVWRALCDIPQGATATYAKIADTVGAPGAARAVGSACGKNPVALLVPCHRVLRGDGALGGYRWGVARKEALLKRERSR